MLVLLVGGFLWFALGTQAGARWLFTRLGGVLPGELDVAELDGPIRGPLTIHGLTYKTDSMEVTIERLFLDWQLRDLLFQRVDIHQLTAEGVDVVMLPGPQTAEQKGPLPDVNLRFNVIVRQAEVRGVRIFPAGTAGDPRQAEPMTIDTIDLATTTLRGGAVKVDRLAMRGPDFDLDANGSLVPRGAYQVGIETTWAYRGGELPEIAGSGTFTATLERLEVDQTLRKPFPAHVQALLHDPLYNLSFELDASAETVRTADFADLFAADLPAVTADLDLHAEGTLDQLSSHGTVRAETADYGRLNARYRLARDGRDVKIGELVLTRPRGDQRITVAGDLVLPPAAAAAQGEPPSSSGNAASEPLRFDLTTSWTDLAWPLTGTPTATSREGTAKISGTTDRYALTADAAIAVAAGGSDAIAAALGPGTWHVEGSGDSESFEVSTLSGELLDGSVTGSGTVRWKPRMAWDLAVAAQGLDPSALADAYPAGDLDLRATSTGHAAQDGLQGRVDLARLDGALLGGSVSASGTILWRRPEDAPRRAGTCGSTPPTSIRPGSSPAIPVRSTWRPPPPAASPRPGRWAWSTWRASAARCAARRSAATATSGSPAAPTASTRWW